MKIIDVAVRKIGRFLAVLSAVVGVLIMVIMLADVVSRNFVSHRSIPGVYELIETLVVLILAFGLVYAEELEVNPRVTLLTDRLSARSAMIVRTVGELVVAVVVTWMAYGVVGQAITATERGEFTQGIIAFPTWPTKILLAVGFVVLAVYVDNRLVRSVVRLATGDIEPKKEHTHAL
ncbi:TRAP transporter small permease subunit [Microbacterium sp. No. 7]|uniref:TRAP transporter small permease subunit n=1 Tax=Microbacterium sp. No. 7 TaxID=1714373 RepID=UPI0006CF8CC1|nr:TRAP transporter small permease [Microbacterium sp. No. 7]ALJ19275.1 hypothetical protein AOA12_04895 [Microbacterium sp. No. 7]